LEPPDLGNEDGVMGNEGAAGKPTTRRYSPEEKAEAVQMVRQLRRELGTTHGTIQRVAGQLGCGVESRRTWVKQAEIDDGEAPGGTTAVAKRIRELEPEVRELRRANEILKRATVFFGAELDRPLK
jgi:transposase